MKKETLIRKPSKLLKILHVLSFIIVLASIVNLFTGWVSWWAIFAAIAFFVVMCLANTEISIIEETA